MAKYILSYDCLKEDVDPFEDIIILLINNNVNPKSIISPVKSTFAFEWNQKVCDFELHSVLKEELEKLCYYCLGECCCCVNSKMNNDSFPSIKKRIRDIVSNYKIIKNEKA